MRKQVKIYKINRREKEFTKDGKNWTSTTVGILVNPDDNVWLNGFEDDQTKSWRKGDEVLVDVETKKTDKGTFYNFKTIDPKELQLQRIEDKLDKVLKYVSVKDTPFNNK